MIKNLILGFSSYFSRSDCSVSDGEELALIVQEDDVEVTKKCEHVSEINVGDTTRSVKSCDCSEMVTVPPLLAGLVVLFFGMLILAAFLIIVFKLHCCL